MTELADIGKRIKKLRKERGFSKAYMAKQFRKCRSAYSLMESSGNHPIIRGN